MSPEYNTVDSKAQNIPTSQFGQSFVISIVAIALLTIVLPLAIPAPKVAPSQTPPTDNKVQTSKVQTSANGQKLSVSLNRQVSAHHSHRLPFEQDAIA
jgi:hypothetical protein